MLPASRCLAEQGGSRRRQRGIYVASKFVAAAPSSGPAAASSVTAGWDFRAAAEREWLPARQGKSEGAAGRFVSRRDGGGHQKGRSDYPRAFTALGTLESATADYQSSATSLHFRLTIRRRHMLCHVFKCEGESVSARSPIKRRLAIS